MGGQILTARMGLRLTQKLKQKIKKGTKLLLILNETLVSLIRILMELYSPCRRVRVFFRQGEMAFINFFSKNLFSCNFYIFLSETLVSLIRIIMELYSPCRRVADRNIFVNSLGSLKKIIASVIRKSS